MNETQTKEFLEKEWNDLIVMRRKVAESFDTKNISLIGQRRENHKIIIQLIVALIATPYLLNLELQKTYFMVGISVLLSLIIFLILYSREVVDTESNSLQKEYDYFLDSTQEKIDIINKYLGGVIVDEKTMIDYMKECNESSLIKKAKEIHETQLKNRKERREKFKQILDYTGEFINFVFLSGILWIVAAIFPAYFNWINIILAEIVVFIITSINFSLLISKIFSLSHHFIRKSLD